MELTRQAYRGAIHWRWDAAECYYLNDDGKPNGPVNCTLMAYHVLHHVHQPNDEDAHLAGWTNRRSREPCYVGGSFCRLFCPDGTIVFPFGASSFDCRVETNGGTFDSAELCRGQKAAGCGF
jgi:hypothetical protein